jgi:3-oxoacyl-[acyl-carrier-protein] synthase-3
MTERPAALLKARIIATGSYVPENVITNNDLEHIVETSDEWIIERTGIRERRIVNGSQATSDLACEAAHTALKRAGLKPRDLDLIIVATVSEIWFSPLQHVCCSRNWEQKAAAFDLNAACSGFSRVAHREQPDQIRRTPKDTAYRRGSSFQVHRLERQDNLRAFLATGRSRYPEGTREKRVFIQLTSIRTKSFRFDLPAGRRFKNPCSKETILKRLHFMKMKGNETFKVAVRTLEELASKTIEENGLDPSQLSLLIPHQANLRIIQATAKRLQLPEEKVFINIEKYGNTSAASIPIALDEAVQAGKCRDGEYILLEAFGGGLTWASALLRW